MITRTKCPVCSTSAAAPLLSVGYSDAALQGYLSRIGYCMPKEWFTGHKFAIIECVACGLLYQREVLDDAQAAELYGRNAADSRLAEDDSMLSLAHLASDALLMRQLIPGPRPRVLDFGMGWGRFALLAQAFGCEVHGVEMSETTREHARRHGIQVFEEAALKDNAYDFILADQVMEHLVDPTSLMRSLVRRLKPGGLMLIGVPGHRRLRGLLRRVGSQPDPVSQLTDRDIDVLSPTIHLNLFDATSLSQLGREAGLVIYRPSLRKALGAGLLWDRPRQWNRNLLLAWKYWRGTGTRMWFQRPLGSQARSA